MKKLRKKVYMVLYKNHQSFQYRKNTFIVSFLFRVNRDLMRKII